LCQALPPDLKPLPKAKPGSVFPVGAEVDLTALGVKQLTDDAINPASRATVKQVLRQGRQVAYVLAWTDTVEGASQTRTATILGARAVKQPGAADPKPVAPRRDRTASAKARSGDKRDGRAKKPTAKQAVPKTAPKRKYNRKPKVAASANGVPVTV